VARRARLLTDTQRTRSSREPSIAEYPQSRGAARRVHDQPHVERQARKNGEAGTYTLVIHDDSSIRNYELAGSHGKSWTFTSVSYVGSKTITLKLTPGKYKAYCPPHESSMFQRFTVS
jgi:hypothetical protein